MSEPGSRPSTPDSPTNSLFHATSTIDDLTLALSNFSRASTPEPPALSSCCCGSEDCEHLKAWLAWKSKLESRLILSAEVGQALLQRHEAYVRRHQETCHPNHDRQREPQRVDPDETRPATRGELENRVSDLVTENAVLEKRLAQALLTTEVLESSNKSNLQDLDEARTSISRMSAQHAKSIGWDTRLSTVMQERDDYHQERDSESHRARMAEVRLAALKETCSKMQLDVRRLQKELEQQRMHRLELSEEILQDARSRLQTLQQSQAGRLVVPEDSEVTKVLETLVADNEALKRDNSELQRLLGQSREDYRSLQDEVEEQRATLLSIRRGEEPRRSRHRYTNSQSSLSHPRPLSPSFSVGTAPSIPSPLSSRFHFSKRTASSERNSRRAFDQDPEPDRPPLSPTEWEPPKWSSFRHPQPRYAPSHRTIEQEDDQDDDSQHGEDHTLVSPLRPRAQKQLHLLTRDRSVQTEGTSNIWPGLLTPSSTAIYTAPSSISPNERSESSSIADSHQSTASTMMNLLDRIISLFTRLSQADALTLTNRLKRQHLHLGADVSHLSQSTVTSIINEATHLRAHFRGVLEDEKVVTICSRKEMRILLRVVRDMFVEMGEMRVVLNDVILDPGYAVRVRDWAMNSTKGEQRPGLNSNDSGTSGGPSGPTVSWMAPISKLFGAGTDRPSTSATSPNGMAPPVRPLSRGPRGRAPPKLVPKLGPALSASATTVNVEFSGTGVGRAVSSSHLPEVPVASGSGSGPGDPARNVMGIFAGAPVPRLPGEVDPWIVVPKDVPNVRPRSRSRARVGALVAPGLKQTRSTGDTFLGSGASTLGRSTLKKMASAHFTAIGRDERRLSRNVDAVIDAVQSPIVHGDVEGDGEDGGGYQQTLLERTLRPRGLSDSSIHTTFMNHGEREGQESQDPTPARQGGWPDKEGVFQALSRKVQMFRLGGALISAAGPSTVIAQPKAIPAVTEDTSPAPVPVPAVADAQAIPSSSPPTSRSTRENRPVPTLLKGTAPNLAGLLPNLTSWSASAMEFEAEHPTDMGPYGGFNSGSPPEEGMLWRKDMQGRGF
ncbi:hypothetical protein JAAARDRAFT_201523 [Jaapia argillacea MUCL 33604]|uniref:Uncharacterized protein n=1 Tax=Jaapia argillacea MUCL 33604 TaxID=933084 RepID=A0A067QAN3_9AGAM|nr:hypothetical protein JAAARDRAFT_201523 [Jaapia argillacea MUCL 33604]